MQQPMNYPIDPKKPWLASCKAWCAHTGDDTNTYERLVSVAFRYGDFQPDDANISEDARWTAQRYRQFSGRRAQ